MQAQRIDADAQLTCSQADVALDILLRRVALELTEISSNSRRIETAICESLNGADIEHRHRIELQSLDSTTQTATELARFIGELANVIESREIMCNPQELVRPLLLDELSRRLAHGQLTMSTGRVSGELEAF